MQNPSLPYYNFVNSFSQLLCMLFIVYSTSLDSSSSLILFILKDIHLLFIFSALTLYICHNFFVCVVSNIVIIPDDKLDTIVIMIEYGLSQFDQPINTGILRFNMIDVIVNDTCIYKNLHAFEIVHFKQHLILSFNASFFIKDTYISMLSISSFFFQAVLLTTLFQNTSKCLFPLSPYPCLYNRCGQIHIDALYAKLPTTQHIS